MGGHWSTRPVANRTKRARTSIPEYDATNVSLSICKAVTSPVTMGILLAYTVGKPAGMLTGNEEEARRYIDWGYLFVAVGADVGLLAKHADALCKRFKP